MQANRMILRELIYDPDETIDQFGARKERALEDGRLAVRARHISGDLYLFYEYLVRRVGGNKYTWVSEDTMAADCKRSRATIKRWIAKLIQVGLIRRERQFATSSHTYIVAYDPTSEILDGTAADHEGETEADAGNNTSPACPPLLGHISEDQGSDTNGLSFQLNHEPSFGSDLHPDHIKAPHLSPGGGGEQDMNPCVDAPGDIRQLLEQEEVSTFYLAPVLAQLPYAELLAVSEYLDKQSNVRKRARLFASLAASGFGAQLLAGRENQRSRSSRTTRSCRPDDHRKYVSGPLAGYIQGWQSGHNECRESPTETMVAGRTENANTELALVQLWQCVLDVLPSRIEANDLAIWFRDAKLFEVDGGRAIIVVPDIFTRDKLTSDYAGILQHALSAVCNRQVQVQIEMGR